MRAAGLRSRAAAALAATALAAAAGPATAEAQGGAPDLSTAAAAILVDAADGHVFLAKSPRERRSIASTTKLMTALLALERARPGEVFTAPRYDALAVESKINLRAGERMSVADLLEALLLESANDAAATLAEGVSGSRETFVAEMNERAAELGLEGTSYANPIGLDDPLNYSTAADLASLTRVLMRRPRFARIVDMPSAELETGAQPRVVANRNSLVAAYPFVDGVKTGFTLQAGNVLIGAASGRGARVISVVMGEPTEAARDADTLALLRYGLSRFRRRQALDAGRAVAAAKVKYRDDLAPLQPARDLLVTVRRGQRLRRTLDLPDEIEGPLEAGTRVGSVTVLRDGRRVARVPLVTAGEVPGASFLRILASGLLSPLTVLLVLVIGGAVALRARGARGRRGKR